ncbi:hypothetical protein NEIFLAOT_00560 [Neisseria flavescens NRL30031/H210]|uniref:Uncharacterized protein n=1 Tax=Neisseria flavescens NRL30031/H210 TaxID=546264 RepID=C0EKV8_NEIFL|nr:hypothetical protein NEIFLAOT_00560 [Neisseria flavescens NRL30031/H210]
MWLAICVKPSDTAYRPSESSGFQTAFEIRNTHHDNTSPV